MKYNGGVAKADLAEENLDALAKGIVNLEKHIENIQKYKVPVIVTLNSLLQIQMRKMNLSAGSGEERSCNLLCPKYGKKVEAVLLAEKVLDTLENKIRL